MALDLVDQSTRTIERVNRPRRSCEAECLRRSGCSRNHFFEILDRFNLEPLGSRDKVGLHGLLNQQNIVRDRLARWVDRPSRGLPGQASTCRRRKFGVSLSTPTGARRRRALRSACGRLSIRSGRIGCRSVLSTCQTRQARRSRLLPDCDCPNSVEVTQRALRSARHGPLNIPVATTPF